MDRLNLMRVFVDIVEQGSMAAVARSRSCAPAAITQALRQLEQLAGSQLLVRTTRRMNLTPEGERFLADCRRILDDVDDSFERVADSGPLRGTLRLTATNDFGRHQLPPLIDAFIEKHPQLRFELVLSDGVTDLVEGHFDLAIRIGPLADSRFRSRRLLTDQRLVCAAPSYWQRHGLPRHPNQLAEHNCLVLDRPGRPQSHWYFSSKEGDFSVKVQGNRTASDGGVLRHWATKGVGVVLKSYVDVKADLDAGRLQAVLQDFTRHDVNIYVVHPGQSLVPRRVQAFLDFLHQAFENEPLL
ncbi:LysR family transcriptional regulator [Gallaecimonas mangrovi]|uniref:LysR family transcriptional regulator n=1 Tax=Gallaecimonas mangrovi TaxID=2291597 RepID=UPI000E201D08|nr:LysR family transcriptional regulator [Gallaecimonas mangrovi]